MIRTFLLSILIAVSSVSFSQDREKPAQTTSSEREALLKKLVAQNSGEITAIEASSMQDGSVIVGFSSGTVLICSRTKDCHQFANTPSVAVEQLAVSKQGTTVVVWVTYRQGALYQCIERRCEKVLG
jgi:hypothetical protein